LPVDLRHLLVPSELAGLRLDVAVTRLAPELSRARVQQLLEQGRVTVGGRTLRASHRVLGGERIAVEVPPPEPTAVAPQDLPLTVLHEDADLLVLDKAAGMVVHPARGTPHSTVVNALLFRLTQGGPAPDESGRAAGQPDEAAPERAGGSGGRERSEGPPVEIGVARLGLVHRLDKETSGCLVVARTEAALQALQAQWKGRSVEKIYLALCHGALAAAGRLDTPYGRHPRDRTRYTGKIESARRALTEWRVRERFGTGASLAEVTLHTGRTHQIRVHLSEAGHPLLADPVYGGARREARLPAVDPVRRAAEAIGRQALHAARLAFDHPRTGRRMTFEAPLPADFGRALEILRSAGR
jgi:23S rRNA pseudouridine1911/1915/1917 synthase